MFGTLKQDGPRVRAEGIALGGAVGSSGAIPVEVRGPRDPSAMPGELVACVEPAPERRFDPERRAYDRRGESAAWVRFLIFSLVVALIAYVRHAARSEANMNERAHARMVEELRSSLEELRSAASRHHLAQRRWPGAADGVDGAEIARELAPLLEAGVPVNPWNGLATIDVLAPGAPWPATSQGTHGWLYRPETGEFRADVPGEIAAGGVRFYDL